MEFYVKSVNDPNFQVDKLQQDDELSILLTQLETILFTNKGEVLGDPNFGASLEEYVYELRYNEFLLKRAITEQIEFYVPLASKYNVDVDVDFSVEVDRFVAFIDITVDSTFKLGVYV